MIFNKFRDGEEITYYDPIATFVQGSLAEERQKSSGRIGKDRKEFKLVKRLNFQNRISFYEIFRNQSLSEEPSGEKAPRTFLLEERLSHLGARYPDVPGLGIYVSGLKNLEGKGQGKKLFDLLFWISSQPDASCYWKYVLLQPIGKLVLNLNTGGKWLQNSTTIFLMLGMNSMAYEFGSNELQNKSSRADSLKRGERLAKTLFIQFYSNTRAYDPKVRRRGYARSSPVRPGSSRKEVLDANSSVEYLTEAGILKKSKEGGYVMEQKPDIERIIFQTFQNSLEAFELYQKQILETKRAGNREEKSSKPNPNTQEVS